jgi:hypothetical protein
MNVDTLKDESRQRHIHKYLQRGVQGEGGSMASTEGAENKYKKFLEFRVCVEPVNQHSSNVKKEKALTR